MRRAVRAGAVVFAMLTACCASGSAPGAGLPEIRVIRRDAVPADPFVAYDEMIRGYEPAVKPAPRFPLPGSNEVPVGMESEEARALVLRIMTRNFRVRPDELRCKEVGKVLRGVNPTFVGWSVIIEQFHRGSTLYNPENDRWHYVIVNTPGGAHVDVFAEDDWDVHANLVDVIEIPGSVRPVIDRARAADIARRALHIRPDQPHRFERLDLGYAPRRDRSDVFVPAWMVDLRVKIDPARIRSYRLAHKGGMVTLDARTGEVIAGDPLREDWPKDPGHWDRIQAEAGDWSNQPPEIRSLLERVRVGMSREKVDEVMRPLTRSATDEYLGGTGDYVRHYEIGPDRCVAIEFGGSCDRPFWGKVVHVGRPGPASHEK